MEISLVRLGAGKRAKIKRIEGGIMFRRRAASLNIRVGKIIRKIVSEPFRGPVIIEIDNRRISLGRGMAMKIFLEVEE